MIVGARRAGISKWAYPLLLYPLISVAIVWFAGEDLLDPWGVSWLWVAAVLGPVVGARTLLNPRPSQSRAPRFSRTRLSSTKLHEDQAAVEQHGRRSSRRSRRAARR